MFGSNQEYEGSLIVKMYGGSHAYGTSLPTSDIDFRGIFVAPPVRIRTPFFPIKEQEDSSEMDTKYYELNQFMKLAMDCNPNIIELLWTDDKDIVFRTPAYDLLREAAPKLLCSKIAFTTSGYALAQLKRLKQSKKKVNFLPDLIKLCELLSQSYNNGEIDETFIQTQCGDEVLSFMKEHKYI